MIRGTLSPAIPGPVDLGDLVSPGTVFSDVVAAGRKAVFQQVGAMAAGVFGLEPRVVADALTARERLGSTGFGGGIAIPHARIDGLERVVGIFLRLAQPIDFTAVDDWPVDLVFVLLSPLDAGALHLKALARVSRCLRDKAFADKLRGAGSHDALYAMLAGLETRDAA